MSDTDLTPSVGLVLGGGGARGFAHVGVMRVLEREGLRPVAFAGTSMGALVGAFFAAGKPASEVETVISGRTMLSLLDLNPLHGMLRADGLRALLAAHLPPTFADLPAPFAVTATDLIEGKAHYFTDGDLYKALACTIAYPGAIDPVWEGGHLFADGGILNQVPVSAARLLGAKRAIAVDATPLNRLELEPRDQPEQWWSRLFAPGREMGTIEALLRASDIMQHQITKLHLAFSDPDVVLAPRMPGVTIFAFNRYKDAIQAGADAAEAALPQIRALFER